MAAIRSALMMLGRRCGSSGSSAVASMGGRGLGIHQVFRPVFRCRLFALQSRNLESSRQFSTAGKEPTVEAEGVLRMWWQQCKNHLDNLDVHDRAKYIVTYATIVLGGSGVYMVKTGMSSW